MNFLNYFFSRQSLDPSSCSLTGSDFPYSVIGDSGLGNGMIAIANGMVCMQTMCSNTELRLFVNYFAFRVNKKAVSDGLILRTSPSKHVSIRGILVPEER